MLEVPPALEALPNRNTVECHGMLDALALAKLLRLALQVLEFSCSENTVDAQEPPCITGNLSDNQTG